MEIELMNEQEINEYLLKLKNANKQNILDKREELFNQYKDAEYIIIHHPNENVISFGKVINIEKREESNHIVDFEYKEYWIVYENEKYGNAREVRVSDESMCHISTEYETSKIEIITEDRFNELKRII